MLDKVMLTFGTFRILRSDNAKGFRNKVIQELTRLLDIEHRLGAPWNPRSQGNIERFHSPLVTSLRSYCYENPKTWATFLQSVVFAKNSSPP